MHPLLLFTLLFLPGIKSFNELQPVDKNDGQISITDIAPIQEPQIDKSDIFRNDKNSGYLQPYERYIASMFKNRNAYERGNDLKYSLSRRDGSDEISHGEIQNYKSTPPSYKYDIKEHKTKKQYLKDGQKGNINKMAVHSNKHLDEKYGKEKHFKDNNFKQIEKYKQHKNKNYEYHYKNVEKGKRFNKGDKREDGKLEKHLTEYPVLKENKYKKAPYSDDKKYIKHNERFERVKRQADESEESSESEPDEEESNESSDEKSVIEHMMVNGYEHESQDPFKDTIEVDVQQKSDETDDQIPVKEDVIKKTSAYISCNEETGLCSKIRKHILRRGSDARPIHENNPEHHENKEINRRKHLNGEVDDAWLRLFEETILKDGVDVKYHPH